MECTNGLLSSEEVNATIQNVWPVPLIGLEFQDWIFPSAKFTCNGYITNLTLQLVLIGNPEDSTTTACYYSRNSNLEEKLRYFIRD